MTQTKDLIKKMADFFASEEYYEKGEDARLELSPDDVRCMNEVINACGNGVNRQAVLDCLTATGLKKYDFILNARSKIKSLPPVKPQEKTGHWKCISMDKYTTHAQYWYRCDKCGEDNLGHTDWCPNCGARMVESQESE